MTSEPGVPEIRYRIPILYLIGLQSAVLVLSLLATVAYTLWTLAKGPYGLGSAFVGALVFIDALFAALIGLLLLAALWLFVRFRRGRRSRSFTIGIETVIGVPCLALIAIGVIGSSAPGLIVVSAMVAVSGLLVIVLSF